MDIIVKSAENIRLTKYFPAKVMRRTSVNPVLLYRRRNKRSK
ncbi:hypothetical protein EUBDOL_00118 [Amedibacillus dolichus DSM 3991]|uniref:Uncharacterized protein n=1 Tax=Amedibacillus dolichus DSM 3991 TaxID=428127 RepID=A8R7Y6_9FIRM|nr:hypothetical protein EUBDOL_00118 [Amedibacillus dolichus DSM 3991]